MKKMRNKIIVAFILFLVATILKFDNVWINNGLYIISYCIVGLSIVKKAFKNIIHGNVFDENFLMTVATIGAFGIGEFPEAVAVMLFYQVGELFQSYAVNKSRKSIAELMDIRPDVAYIEKDGVVEEMDPDDVQLDDVIVVKPGEKIPLDGIVIEGNGSVDTKALTGESVARSINVGDEILSGCINLNGVLRIKVTKEFEESTVSKILDLVENASSKKSKSENFISKFAKYYTPIVVIIAVILAIVPPIILKEAMFSDWLYRALSFLVVSCPCALVISVPLSFFGGLGGASKLGVLIKGSNYLEAISNVETIVFDKTGTLTEGVFAVQKIYPINISEDKLLEVVAYAENYSNHPIALSIKQAYSGNIDESKILDIKELSGLGIEANIDEQKVLVGNEKLLLNHNIHYSKSNDIGTILYIAINDKSVGYIVISDKIKENCKESIFVLKKHNIRSVMLTGDKREIGEAVANELQLDAVCTELLPQDKVHKMEELMNTKKNPNGKLAFVGDGINDAPVLALADIGISMGALGSDAAIEASDVVLMTDDISKIATTIQLAKKNMRIVRENIVFAISVKILVLILSALGISTMWIAVFADVGVSIIAIVNSLRMLIVHKNN